MRIEFIGIDPRTHRFRVVRDDGSEESEVLETRSRSAMHAALAAISVAPG